MVEPLSPVLIWSAVTALFAAVALVSRAFRRVHQREFLACPVHHTAYEVESAWASGPGLQPVRADVTGCAHFHGGRVTCAKRCLEGPGIFELRQRLAGACCWEVHDPIAKEVGELPKRIEPPMILVAEHEDAVSCESRPDVLEQNDTNMPEAVALPPAPSARD